MVFYEGRVSVQHLRLPPRRRTQGAVRGASSIRMDPVLPPKPRPLLADLVLLRDVAAFDLRGGGTKAAGAALNANHQGTSRGSAKLALA